MIRTLTPLYVGRQPRFAVEAKSYPAALQNLHCLHSLPWRGLLGPFSSDPPAITFDVTFLVFDQEKDLPGEVPAFLSFSHFGLLSSAVWLGAE